MRPWWLPLLLLGCADYTLLPPDGAGVSMRVCPAPIRLPPPGEDARFDVGVAGRDVLVGLRWHPAQGSRLDIDVSVVGERTIGIRGDRFGLGYSLFDTVAPDTATARDDGILRLFFRESPPVDVWVEVVRGAELARWEAEQAQIASGVRNDPCAGLVEDVP